jgi:hypothetical protein
MVKRLLLASFRLFSSEIEGGIARRGALRRWPTARSISVLRMWAACGALARDDDQLKYDSATCVVADRRRFTALRSFRNTKP